MSKTHVLILIIAIILGLFVLALAIYFFSGILTPYVNNEF